MFSNQALKKLLIPLVIEQILAMLVGMTDTLMVSSAGEAAVSGVALVDMVNFLMIYHSDGSRNRRRGYCVPIPWEQAVRKCRKIRGSACDDLGCDFSCHYGDLPAVLPSAVTAAVRHGRSRCHAGSDDLFF